MQMQRLVDRLSHQCPNASPLEMAQMCIVVLNSVDDHETLSNEEVLDNACRSASLRLQFAVDQHAAMAAELEDLAASDPRAFTPDQIWTLVRAIKVQSQVLQLYLGEAALDV